MRLAVRICLLALILQLAVGFTHAQTAPEQTRSLDEEGQLMLLEGRRLVEAGRAQDALPFYAQALDMAEVQIGVGTPALGLLLHELGVVHRSAGELARAEQNFERALGILESALGTSHAELLPALADLASSRAARDEAAQAQLLYERLVALLRLHRPAGDTEIIAALGQLALSLDRQGQRGEAEAYYRQALEEARGQVSESSLETATILNNLGSLYVLQGRYVEAEPLHRRAAELRRRLLGPSHWLVAVSLSDLARDVERLGRRQEALDLATRAAAVLAPYCQGLSAEAAGERRSAQELCLDTEELRRRLKGEGSRSDAELEPSPQSVAMRGVGAIYRAQVLSREDPDLAHSALRQMKNRFADLLEGVPAHVETIDLGDKGIWYRLQFGDFTAHGGARQLCLKLLDRGWNDCWVTQVGADESGELK